MSTFSTTPLDTTVLDPRKRVRYATGLVLGVDEFQQEQTYLMERDRRHQRALHGYGTVHGLQVRARVRDGEAELLVTPGLAVDPLGRDICVPEPQCARVDAWLAAHAEEVREAVGSFPDAVGLHVLLCHRECETDTVPIPGSPCRSEDEARAATRIADDFELSLSLAPPKQVEEEAVRRLGALLRRLRRSREAPVLTAGELVELVRGLAESPDGEPAGGEPLHLHPDEAADLLRLAFQVWTVEVRPRLAGEGGCSPPPEACVALGRVDVALTEIGGRLVVDAGAPEGEDGVAGLRLEPRGRPYLLSTRVLQEWLALCTCGPEEEPVSFPDDELLLALNDLVDVEAAPSAGDVLSWDAGSGSWVAATPAAGTTDHGALVGLGDDDHPQYLLVDGTRPMGGDLDADGNRVVGLPPAAANGQAVPFQQAVKDGDTAGGDLSGTYRNPTVRALLGRSLSTTAPSANQVLRWNGSAWAPATLTQPPPSQGNFEEGLVRITGASWAHRGTSTLQVVLDGQPVSGIVVAFGFQEMQDGGRVRVGPGSLDAQSFQLFAETDDGADFYRYRGIRPDARFNRAILPVQLEDPSQWPWQVSSAPQGEPADAAFFPLSDGAQDGLFGSTLRVVVHGDFVLDEEGRAIDAEHVRGRLAGSGSGDRPAGAELGLQGGRFESWFRVGEVDSGPSDTRIDREAVDVNRASREELMTLPGIGGTLADRIIESRETEGAFDAPEDLQRVTGITERVLTGMRDQIRT